MSTISFPYFSSRRVHLGVCGSIAAYKAADLMRLMQKNGLHVSVTLTPSACRFITPLTFQSLGATAVYSELFEAHEESPFGHLAPGAGAEAFVIAPASASTMARLATGLADTMLSAQALAYTGPLVIAPAMNPRMWQHPATQANYRTLAERNTLFVTPVDGQAACGDVGTGKLADIDNIFYSTLKCLSPQDMTGEHVLLTIGPTREHWDGVRFWSNPSSGFMGSALAIAAWLRGATVHAVTGPGVPTLPSPITQVCVTSAAEMFDAADTAWEQATIGIFTAAVADFSPKPFGNEKFKKTQSPAGFSLEFLPNKDILADLGARKKLNQRILGFAAETQNLEQAVIAKLRSKNADLMAGNIIGQLGSGFGSHTNSMYLCDRNGRTEHHEHINKTDVAWRLLSWLLSL